MASTMTEHRTGMLVFMLCLMLFAGFIAILSFSLFKFREYDQALLEKKQLILDLQTDVRSLREKVFTLENKFEEETAYRAVAGTGEIREKRDSTLSNEQTITLTLDDLLQLRGRDGKDGKDGINGVDGKDGRDGENSRSGVNYIRWGRQDCPANTSVILPGLAAGNHYLLDGGAAEYMCLPLQPEYPKIITPPERGFTISRLSAVEFDQPATQAFGQALQDQNLACAICEAPLRSEHLMLPARWNCPAGWTREYTGYLMTSPGTRRLTETSRRPTQFICVDHQPVPLAGYNTNGDGALISHVAADCGANQHRNLGYCPPYRGSIALSCVVCTK